jgi:hypothetical protein
MHIEFSSGFADYTASTVSVSGDSTTAEGSKVAQVRSVDL